MVVNVLQGDALLGWRAYKALQRIRQALQDCVERAERLEATS
jgi:hypothetical protein